MYLSVLKSIENVLFLCLQFILLVFLNFLGCSSFLPGGSFGIPKFAMPRFHRGLLWDFGIAEQKSCALYTIEGCVVSPQTAAVTDDLGFRLEAVLCICASLFLSLCGRQ